MNELGPQDFFPDDYAYYVSVGSKNKHVPWENREQSLNNIVNEWNDLRPNLENGFQKREKGIIQPNMLWALSLYLKLLFWTNGKPVTLNNLKEELDKLTIKPINIGERLLFILEKPYLYPSYLQLTELFVEQQKAFYRYKAMGKKKE